MCIAPISDFAYSVKYFSVTASIHKVIKQSTSAGLWGERERLEWQQRFRGETWDIKRLQRSRLEFTVPRWSWSGGRLPVPHQEGGGGGGGWEEKWWVVHVLLWTQCAYSIIPVWLFRTWFSMTTNDVSCFVLVNIDLFQWAPPLFHTVALVWSHQIRLWPKKAVFGRFGPFWEPSGAPG